MFYEVAVKRSRHSPSITLPGIQQREGSVGDPNTRLHGSGQDTVSALWSPFPRPDAGHGSL